MVRSTTSKHAARVEGSRGATPREEDQPAASGGQGSSTGWVWLFVGGMLGAAVGTLQARFFPAYTGPVGDYALVGMGTLFAGFLRVPMTSVFMVLETSGNYSIILPVLVLFFLAQKTFIEGIATTGMKG